MTPTVLRVGLTGNIAAGKSTVAARLRRLGCTVVDADDLAHDCLDPATDSGARVVAAFGEGIVRRDGTIDRRALGRLVFADDEARRRLESILHPAIRDREDAFVADATAGCDAAIAVTEAALLYETGSAARYHRMVVVIAPDELRRRRLAAQGLSDREATERMAAQMDQRTKAKLADYVIENGGTLTDAEGAVDTLHTRLQDDLGHLAAGRLLPPPHPVV